MRVLKQFCALMVFALLTAACQEAARITSTPTLAAPTPPVRVELTQTLAAEQVRLGEDPDAALATAQPTLAVALVTPRPTATSFPPAYHVSTYGSGSSLSPDDMWRAMYVTMFPASDTSGRYYYTWLAVVKTDGSVAWTVVDEWVEWRMGYTIPRLLHWSRDGRYLYFTNQPVPDGCQLFINGSDLQQVDLANGSVTEIVPPVGLWLSMSPDETTLAYVGYENNARLILRDLKTGAERGVQLPSWQDKELWQPAGDLLWSPDGTALMLTVALEPCSTPGSASVWAESTSLVRVNTVTLEVAVLIDDDQRVFTTVEWPGADRVRLKDGEGSFWWMDPETGEITMVESEG